MVLYVSYVFCPNCFYLVARARQRLKFKRKKKELQYLLLRKHKADKADSFMHVYDIIFYINCVFVQIRTGCCGNFCILCFVKPGQYSGERL